MNEMQLWARAALVRALKTAAQVAGAMIGTGAVFWDLNWAQIGGVTATATVLSLLWSVRGLPEVDAALENQAPEQDRRYNLEPYDPRDI